MSARSRLLRQLMRVKKRAFDPSKDVQAMRRSFANMKRRTFPFDTSIQTKEEEIDDVEVVRITPDNAKQDKLIIYLHGGGFVFGSAASYQRHMARLARLTNTTVLGVNYRKSPEHPFPAPLDDLEQVWEQLLHGGVKAKNVVFAGDSAGGNIVIASLLRMRDRGIELPAAGVALSPAIDAEFSGKSYAFNEKMEVLLTPEKLDFFLGSYVQGNDPYNPYVSPMYASDLSGLPPILIQVGADEVLLSDALTLQENAHLQGVDTITLQQFKDVFHGWQLFYGRIPEANTAMHQVAEFIALNGQP